MIDKSEILNANTAAATLFAFLSDPRSYPQATSAVEVRDTHMSRVFLTEHFAYKLKKPVTSNFLDYSTPEIRRAHCEAEIRLNRRLAAPIYLGVVPVCLTEAGKLQLGQPGQPVDWLVQMRRLPADFLLDHVLTGQDLSLSRLEPVIHLLARFYRESPPVNLTGEEYVALLHSQILNNTRALRGLDRQSPCERIAGALHGFIDSEARLLAHRARRVVDGHGDLRPEHVYFGTPPAIIDCIEFNRNFRVNDPLNEIAFLDMECRRKRNDRVGKAFADAYCEIWNDDAPEKLMAFYRAQSALLRAKLTLWHLEDYPGEAEKWLRQAHDYLNMAAAEATALT